MQERMDRREIDNALIKAVNQKQLDKARDLLLSGANASVITECGNSLLWEVLIQASPFQWPLMELLLEFGANTNCQKNGKQETILHQYIFYRNCYVDFIKLFIKHGANPNLENIDKMTPLHLWIEALQPEDSLDTLKALIEGGAKVNCKNSKGESLTDTLFKNEALEGCELRNEVMVHLVRAVEVDTLPPTANVLGQGMRSNESVFFEMPKEIVSHIIKFTSLYHTDEEVEKRIEGRFNPFNK